MDLILYTQPGCNQCRLAHMLLDQKNIKYTEVQDISEMQKQGIRHTPALKLTSGELLTGKDLITYVKGL